MLSVILGMSVVLLYALTQPQDVKRPTLVGLAVIAVCFLGIFLSLINAQWNYRRMVEMATAVEWVSNHGPPEESALEAHPEP